MRKNYLINKHFYIKNDLQSLLIYYDFFSQGISFPKLKNQFILKIAHSLLRFSIIFMYITKFYLFIYKTTNLSEDALIIINGQGSWGSTIKLIKKNNKFKIIKKIRNANLYQKEKDFYNLYNLSNFRIKIPKCIFLDNNIIEMDFINAKSFQRQAIDGSLSLKSSLLYFEDLKRELLKFYGEKETLIHGDLFLPNIYIKDNNFYLIDFTDSHINTYIYDIYVLLFSILCSYNVIDINEKTLMQTSVYGKNVVDFLGITKNELAKVEKQFIAYREARFPGFYN